MSEPPQIRLATPYKLGTRVHVFRGPHAGKDGFVVGRKPNLGPNAQEWAELKRQFETIERWAMRSWTLTIEFDQGAGLGELDQSDAWPEEVSGFDHEWRQRTGGVEPLE